LENSLAMSRHYNLALSSAISITFLAIIISTAQKKYNALMNQMRQKNILLAEVNHRVKNNLSVIIGIIRLKQGNTENKEVYDALTDFQNRILSIASIHNQMYKGNEYEYINLNSYASELITNLRESHIVENNVKINREVESVDIHISKVIPCGLILNELITNSFKHAFSNVNDPTISISFKEHGGHFNFTYNDNGIGVDNEILKNESGIGISIIETLADQLDAKYEFASDNGLHFRMTFKP